MQPADGKYVATRAVSVTSAGRRARLAHLRQASPLPRFGCGLPTLVHRQSARRHGEGAVGSSGTPFARRLGVLGGSKGQKVLYGRLARWEIRELYRRRMPVAAGAARHHHQQEREDYQVRGDPLFHRRKVSKRHAYGTTFRLVNVAVFRVLVLPEATARPT